VICLVEIFASLQRTGRSPYGRVNQDKNFVFLLFSLLLISLIQLLRSLKLTGLKSDHKVEYILNICFSYIWINCVSGLFLIYWIVFNHIESGLKHFYTETIFLGLYSIISVVHNWLFTGQSRITRVNWLNQEFSFSTSRTNQICEKFLKVQFTAPLELGLNLILQLASELGSWILVKISIHGREQVTFCWRCIY